MRSQCATRCARGGGHERAGAQSWRTNEHLPSGVYAFDPTDHEAMLDAVIDLGVRISKIERLIAHLATFATKDG